MMHKEVVKKRKAPVIVLLTIILCCVIVISQSFKPIIVGGFRISVIVDPILLILMISFIVLEIKKCNIQYKYSIIGEEFIINKMSDKELCTLQDIYINDIVSIKRVKSGLCKSIFARRYFCNIISSDIYCCSYKSDNKIKKFYFQPSNCLVEKIKRRKAIV